MAGGICTGGCGADTSGKGALARIWLLAQGWTASATADALGRDPHTIGRWAGAFGEGGPLDFRAVRRFPPALGEAQQAELKGQCRSCPRCPA